MVIKTSNLNFWRRSAKLSLRGLLIVILMLGGWLGWTANHARTQREAVQIIEAAGGYVTYDSELADDGPPNLHLAKSLWPRWLVAWLGRDYFEKVYSVSLVFQESDDAPKNLLPQISRLDSLQGLFFRGYPAIEDADLIHIRDLTQLKRLVLSSNRIRGPGLINLTKL